MNEQDKRPVALIAGGAGGMGRAICATFARQGYRVAIADLASTALDQAVLGLGTDSQSALAVSLNLRQPGSCEGAVSQVIAWAGRVDVLVNAAGVWREGDAASVTEADWDLVMDVNLKGAFFLIQAVLPHLQAGASIVNIASDAGLVGNAGAALYCASKGGLVLLTKALALELAPRQIRVNAVCPGDVATPMIEFQAQQYGMGDPDGYKRRLLAHYPQGAAARFLTAEEVAQFVAYLCAPEAAPITGAALSMDFGVTAGY
ncbi:short-chain dehydrogenase [Cypionkella aquatica]|uniref:Short-chain dehydrogenase n=1 Tax=Cypionkella aquatica TaxID=1756042 RepID=A0AA37TTQ7_9RHOB|nr:SDR family oxidoreductase [Cypionkella aquatica]GLS87157.1 short-chain dehydrogenase [Cypionkella aquatica]